MLETLDHALELLDSRSDLRGERRGTSGRDTGDLDRRPRNDRDDRYEWGKIQSALPLRTVRRVLRVNGRRSPAQSTLLARRAEQPFGKIEPLLGFGKL